MSHTLLKRLPISLSCLSALVFAPAGQAATPLGDPIMVNTDTAGNQIPKFFSAGTNGEKFLVWSDAAANTPTAYTQGIKSSGIPYSVKNWAAAETSSFSVGWDGSSVVATPPGLVRLMSRFPYTEGWVQLEKNAWNPVARLDTDGYLTVAYLRPNAEFSPQSLVLTRFHRRGYSIIREVVAASDVPGGPERLTRDISTATDKAQNIALLWKVRTGSSPDRTELRMQRFDRQGTALTPVQLVSTDSPIYQSNSSLSMEPGGKSLVVWSASADANQTWNVYARCYDANGAPLTGPLKINQTFLLSEPEPTAGMTENGDFVVAWKASNGVIGGTPTPALAAREFHGNGTPIGNEFRIDPPQSQPASRPLLAMDLTGNFSVAWSSTSAQTGEDVMVRTYKMATRPHLTEIVNNRAVQGLAGAADSWTYYKFTLPYWVEKFNIDMTGPAGGGDADMYVRLGALPSSTAWDWRPNVNGSNESVELNFPVPGEYYIAIRGRSAYSSVGLKAVYDFRF